MKDVVKDPNFAECQATAAWIVQAYIGRYAQKLTLDPYGTLPPLQMDKHN